MTIARIDNGQVAEYRDDITLQDVPPHKQDQWLPVVDTKPAYDASIQYLTGPVVAVNAGVNVTRTWTVVDKTITAAMVKDEAQRRIIVRTGAPDLTICLTKQLNALMRATELNNIKLDNGVWTAEEAAEAAVLKQLADDIKLIRAKSDEIEAMSPIPLDYAVNDSYWT